MKRGVVFGGLLVALAAVGLSEADAQATLIQRQWLDIQVDFRQPRVHITPAGGVDIPFLVPDGTVKSLFWPGFYVSTGWRDLHIRYTLPSGVYFDQRAGDPWVDASHTHGEESGGWWHLNLMENVPGPSHLVSTGFAVVTQRHADPDLPVTGEFVPELAGLDEVMLGVMRALGFEAGTLVVVKDRRRVYERGFGWQDRERTMPIDPQAVMRLASMTVVITARAIHQLADDGLLGLDEKVFDVLGIAPLPGYPITDPRVHDFTIRQLLAHTSGVREGGDLPDGAPFARDLGELLGLGRNATLEEAIAFMWSQGLLSDPGTSWRFSHWGYQVLGKVIEVRSGMTYGDYVHDVVGVGDGMPTIRLARDGADEAYPGEIWYAGEYFQHHEADFYRTGPLVEQSYAVDYSARPAAGSLIASARDYARLLTLSFADGRLKPVDLTGIPYDSGGLAGSLPGTTTVGRDRVFLDGTSLTWVALTNERKEDGTPCNDILYHAIEDFLAGVTLWPARCPPRATAPATPPPLPPAGTRIP